MPNNHYEVVVIGGGPAGLTAGVYLKRANKQVLIIEKSTPGGKINYTASIENYPGAPNITGADLAFKMYEQAVNLGVEFDSGTIIEITKEKDSFKIVSDEDTYFAQAVIVASGTSEKLLNVPGEKEFYGRGISYCAVCDGALYKGKDVAVIGGGNSAFEEALYLSDIVDKVYLIHRNDRFRADALLITKVKDKANIEIIQDTVLVSISGEQLLNTIEIKNVLNNKTAELNVSAVFPFIGTIPNTQFLKSFNILDEQAYVLVDNKMATSVDGLYAIGDVIKKNLRQIVTATSDGAIAATSVTHYLKR